MMKLLLLGIGLALLIWAFAYVVGLNGLEEAYLKDYERLVKLVYTRKVTRRNFNMIKREFDLIDRYACKNDEKLSVLEYYFYNRFNEVNPKEK